MKQNLFEAAYQSQWLSFESQLQVLEKHRKKSELPKQTSIKQFPENYQIICQHLAIAQSRGYSSALVEHLQQLVQRGHQILYKRHRHLLHQIVDFVLITFPQTIRQEKTLILTTTLIFYGVLLLSATITSYHPDFIHFFMSVDDVVELEKMYDPAGRLVGPMAQRGAEQNWLMFAFYIYNNIGIAFQMFAGGIVFCLGTLFYLLYNALVIGAIASHLTTIGYGETFWPFVIGHGAFELTALTIAAAAGLKLGLAILIPQNKTRVESLRLAAKTAITLVFGAFFLLIIAAFVEGYWSSINGINMIRYTVGVFLWLTVFCYFAVVGRQRSNHVAA